MKAIQFVEKGVARVADIPLAPMPAGHALLRVKAAGLCHTDIDVLHARYGTGAFPLVPGHEYAGEVVDVAADVTSVQVGSRVAVDPNLPCGTCPSCRKGLTNLAVRPETPREILATAEPARLYSLVADESVVAPRSFAGTALLHEATVAILRKYVDRFYRVRQERWDSEHMVYTELDDEDANFQDYTVRIARGEAELITAIQKLIEEADSVYRQDTRELPSIHFDRHLYQPLLVETFGTSTVDPARIEAAVKELFDAVVRHAGSRRLADDATAVHVRW